jgi:hypothetical protein
MSKAEISLENARRDAKTWHKLLGIENENDHVMVTVVRGLSLGVEPLILADKLKFARSPELDQYLASAEIQQKLFVPSKRGIVLIDVAGYSQFDTRGQSAILTTIHEGLQLAQRSSDLFSRESSIDQIIPTGDGCFIVFKADVVEHVFQSVFSIHSSFYCHQKRLLAKNGKSEVKDVLGIRLACHVGEVDFIIDAAGNRNGFGVGLNETARILQYGRPALKEKLGGVDPTGVAFFDKNLDSQAAAFIEFFRALHDKGGEFVDLGKVTAKHDLELELRCLTKLPNHIAFPFNSGLPQDKGPHPVFLTA